MILNANAENAASSVAGRESSLSDSSTPLTGGRSAGEGNNWITASSIACTPLFLNAVPQNTGMIVPATVPLRIPAMISASDSAPSSRYLFIKSSEVSAAASTRNECAFSQASLSDAGMSRYSNFKPCDSTSQ